MNNLKELAKTMRRFVDLEVLCASIATCPEEIRTIEELIEMLDTEVDYVICEQWEG